MRRRNDWIYLMYRTIDAHTIFWIRCERWIYHLCLKKNDFQSWNKLKKILDVNKKSFKRISKLFLNRLNINYKKNNSWNICNFARKIVEWRDYWSRKKIKEILESKIRKSQIRWSIVFMWQKTFIQWMLLFDQRISFDWMKIERRNDEKNRKNSWNKLKN
jgi:hypothetical protein